MATSISFDYNGTPVTINTPISTLAWRRTPVYVGPTTLFNYILGVSFNDGTKDLTLELRIYTDTPALITYELANQAGMTDSVDIALSNSGYIRSKKNNEIYNSDSNGQIVLTAISSVPDCDGTFTADLVLYRDTPIINNTLPILTDPTIIDTISITNGVFNNIPII